MVGRGKPTIPGGGPYLPSGRVGRRSGAFGRGMNGCERDDHDSLVVQDPSRFPKGRAQVLRIMERGHEGGHAQRPVLQRKGLKVGAGAHIGALFRHRSVERNRVVAGVGRKRGEASVARTQVRERAGRRRRTGCRAQHGAPYLSPLAVPAHSPLRRPRTVVGRQSLEGDGPASGFHKQERSPLDDRKNMFQGTTAFHGVWAHLNQGEMAKRANEDLGKAGAHRRASRRRKVISEKYPRERKGHRASRRLSMRLTPRKSVGKRSIVESGGGKKR